MSANGHITDPVLAANDVAGNAVGVGKSQWFVALVKHNTEKQTRDRLTKIGVENYLATQNEMRVWKNGRKSKVERVVITGTIFIHCTEQERKEIVKLPYINRFMTNRSGVTENGTVRPLAIVPDREIRQLKFMLGQDDIPVDILPACYRKGQRVRVVRGSLKGLEGEVVETKSNRSELIVNLEMLGCAHLEIDTINLQPAE